MPQSPQSCKFLPVVRGQIHENYPLGQDSWFRCGGNADLLFQPADFDDLADFLKQWPGGQPLLVLGGMANTIVRDGGVRGCVLRLGKAFSDIEVQGTQIMAGGGALNGSVASAAAKAGLGGLEFMSGIPGSVGGALRMNAGAYGSEIKDVLVEATALNREGLVKTFKPEDMGMAYRQTCVPEGTIFTHAVFEGKAESHETVRERLKKIKAERQETQPITEKTGGSTFANPEGQKAWQLIEQAGCRGLQIGGAQMSGKHCNFMINTGDATAADLENLGEEVRQQVKEKTGVELHWEIKRIGDA